MYSIYQNHNNDWIIIDAMWAFIVHLHSIYIYFVERYCCYYYSIVDNVLDALARTMFRCFRIRFPRMTVYDSFGVEWANLSDEIRNI